MMEIRSRISDAISGRIAAILPEAARTIWGDVKVVCAIETMKPKPAGAQSGKWWLSASLDGVFRVDLRSDRIDDLDLSALVASLVEDPVHINPEASTPVGQMGEKGRIVLIDLRDTIRDASVATMLRFDFSGHLVRRLDDPIPISEDGPGIREDVQ